MIPFSEIEQSFTTITEPTAKIAAIIKLSRLLDKPSDELIARLPQIKSCESDLFCAFDATTKKMTAYASARIMRGILVIIIAYLKEITDYKQLDLIMMCDRIGITRSLSETRIKSLRAIEHIIKTAEHPDQAV